jgi:hypothetical protein
MSSSGAIFDWLWAPDRTIASSHRHADEREEALDQPPADQPRVRLTLRHDLIASSVHWACLALNLPHPTQRA